MVVPPCRVDCDRTRLAPGRDHLRPTVIDSLETAMAGTSPATARSGADWLSALPPLDFLDLVGLGAARRHYLDAGALGLADERAGKRRGNRDLALLGIGLGLADDLPHLLLLGVLVEQR